MTRFSIVALSALALSLSEPTAAAVGRTQGEAAVSPVGDAVYSIPIKLPAGINGLTPDLSLSYSHSQLEGLAGVGWGVSGLSVIARCPKTVAQDGTPDGVNLERDDRLCLDGNQLRLTSGTYGYSGSQYRTEVDMIARVTAYGSAGDGPAWFKVEAKGGLIYEYGNTADSRIESLALGDDSTVRVWALSKMSDRAGNEIQFTYTEDGAPFGSYRPTSIKYGINPAAGQTMSGYKVSFVYETQPALDVDTSYATAGVVEDIKRLTAIRVDQHLLLSNRVRSYELTYETSLSSANRSRLMWVRECGKTTFNCLAPLTFTYQDGTSDLDNETASGSTIPSGTKPLAIDINGDGRTDLAYPSAASGGTWMYRLANASGGYGSAQSTGISSANHDAAIAIDHNTDGLDDILVPTNGTTWSAIQGTSSGLSSLAVVDTLYSYSNSPGDAAALDVNGDGRDDLVWITSSGGIARIRAAYRSASGDGFDTAVIMVSESGSIMPVSRTFEKLSRSRGRNFDVNGDGYQDVGYVRSYWEWGWDGPEPYWDLKVVLGNSQGTWVAATGNPFLTGVPIDLNGDGYTDIAYSESSNLSTRISNGKNFGTAYAVSSDPNLDWTQGVVLDWNGDGMEDFLAPHSNGYWYIAKSDGFKLQTPTSTGLSTGSPTASFATDSDGDGLHDIAYAKSTGAYVHRTHAGVKPDLLTDVTDGYGNTVEFHYGSLSDSSVYTRGTGATLPETDYLEPRLVVKTLEQSDGVGSTFTIDYQYEGATRNVEGRGIGGFAKRIVTDNRSGNVVTETYHTDFPYRGRVKKRELNLSDNTLVQEITHTWNKLAAGTGFQEYFFPYISNTIEKNFEVGGIYNGDQINTVSTTSIVDSYGTPYDVTVVTTEHTDANGAMPGTAFTQRTYTPTGSLHNVTGTWCIGRRQKVQRINSHTSTYGASITRTTDYTWDTTSNCRITKRVVEPSSSDYKVTVDLEYDQFGNVDKQTVTGVDTGTTMPARVTETGWSTDGRFLETLKNPLLQTTTVGWDSVTGDLLSVTDPNGLVRSWLYDDFNRKTRETNVDGTFTDLTLSACTNDCDTGYSDPGYSLVKTKLRATQKTAAGSQIRFDDVFLDVFDREVETASQIIGGGTTKTRTIYDAVGRAWKRSSPTKSTSTLYYAETSFDAIGRPKQISRPIHDGTSVLQHTYIDYEGLTTKTTDAEGNLTWKILDALGRVHQSHDNLSHYQQFDFDAFGSVKRVQDCVISTCDVLMTNAFDYGASAFKVQSDDMSLGVWDYAYNSLGEMTAYNDAKTQDPLSLYETASFTYDKLGRILSRSESEGVTTWTWGTSAAAKNIGQLASVSAPGHSQSFTFDSYGRLKQHLRVGGGTYDIDYGYSTTTGLLESIEYPASTGGYRFKVQQEYDYGVLKRVKRADSPYTVYWEANTQDAFGNVIDEYLGNGTTTIRGFDGVTGRIDSLKTDNGALQDLTYSWDKVGNLLSRKDWRQSGNPTEVFDYDSLNRMTDADISGAATSSLGLQYDENGNIDVKDDVGAGTWTYHATKKHAVTSAGGNSYSYDANGNMTSRKGDAITWTSYNYPSEIDDGPRNYQYSYDADRQKWKQVYDNGSTVETTYFAGRIFEKNVNSSDTDHRHYIMANGRAVAMFVERASNSDYTRYFTHDHLGGTDGIVKDDGSLHVAESFSAFGERRDPIDWVGAPSASDLTKIADSTDRGYTDHVNLEQSSLIHMNGRVFDAEIGRFLSPDPYVTSPMNTQGFNRYAYVMNNPMRYTDPSGFYCTDAAGIPVCAAIFASIGSFLFGDDEPPPPDFCKDNASGCGGPLPGIEIRFTLNLFYLPLDDEDDEKKKKKESRLKEWFKCMVPWGGNDTRDCNMRFSIRLTEETADDVEEATEEAAEVVEEVAATAAECSARVLVGLTPDEIGQNIGEEVAERVGTRAIDEVGNVASETVQDVLHRAQGKPAGKLVVKRVASVAPGVGQVIWTVDGVRIATCTYRNVGAQE